MTDLHTHILPGMDDGVQDVETSLEMLRLEWTQGVDRVVFTPHFHWQRENIKTFLARREESLSRLVEAIHRLPREERATLPRWEVGAEVDWTPDLAQREELCQLCLGRGNYFLLELPFGLWSGQIVRQLCEFMGRTPYIPVISHLDRYWDWQWSSHITDLLQLGIPIQLRATALLKLFSRGRALRAIDRGQVHLLASDCQGIRGQLPDLGRAMDIVKRRLGPEQAHRLCRWAEAVCPSRGMTT